MSNSIGQPTNQPTFISTPFPTPQSPGEKFPDSEKQNILLSLPSSVLHGRISVSGVMLHRFPKVDHLLLAIISGLIYQEIPPSPYSIRLAVDPAAPTA